MPLNAVDMGSSAMIYTPVSDWFRHSKVDWEGIHRDTDSMVIS
jgi:hypothetical protein